LNKPKIKNMRKLNKTTLYSFCAALFLLTCSLSTKAQDGHNMANAYLITTTFGTGLTNWDQTSCYTTGYGLTNSYTGSDNGPGNDKWHKFHVSNYGYIRVVGGTADQNFDSILHLLDNTGYELAYSDDGAGSGQLQGLIDYFVGPGDYYYVVDGTDKSGHIKNGAVSITVIWSVNHL
jgi:hypothetical protein